MFSRKKILVAPVFWGLGHATRCIPLIYKLIENDFEVVIASDGAALDLLRQEFPNLDYVELPSYKITYPKYGIFFKITMIIQLFRISRGIRRERKLIRPIIKEKKIDGIISDGRLGIWSREIPSVYVTHQLNLNTGSTSFFSKLLHRRFIKNFDACWVPDSADRIGGLSGKLGHTEEPLKYPPVRYIGNLSRMKKKETSKNIDILAILSGPEPQRTLLEKKLLHEFQTSNKKIVLIQGLIGEREEEIRIGSVRVVNYMLSGALEEAINNSKLIVARSGYSSLMDLAKLQAKAFLIPTPGQYEQQYLAKRLHYHAIAPYSQQQDFKLNMLEKIKVYKGLSNIQTAVDWQKLFEMFRN